MAGIENMANHESGIVLPPYVDFKSPHSTNVLVYGDIVADGRYGILDTVDRHNNTEVYRASDWESADGDVALKIFHEPDVYARQHVDRELAAHLILDGQPGMPVFRDFGILEKDDGPRRYIATEFAAGGTLNELSRYNPKDIDMTLSMAADIIPAIGLMHDEGIIHRDIKPPNILANREGSRWQLTDFGIVEAVSAAEIAEKRQRNLGALAIWEADTITTAGLYGTIGYIAPENFDPNELTGPEVDVFALGVTIYNTTTGRMPFGTGELREYVHSVTNESPASSREYNRAIPAELSRLTMDCLRHDPADRPTINELERGLQGA